MKGPKGCTEFCCLCRIALHVGLCFVFNEFCFCLSCQCFLLSEVNMCWISFDHPLLNIFCLPPYFLSLPEALLQWLCLVVKLLVHHAVQMFPIKSVKESTYVPCLLCTLLGTSPFSCSCLPLIPLGFGFLGVSCYQHQLPFAIFSKTWHKTSAIT